MKKLISILFGSIISLAAHAGSSVLIPLAAYTTSQASVLQYRTTEQKIHVIIDVTSAPSSGTLTPVIYAEDTLGNIYPLLIGTAISTTGITVLKVGPGFGQITNAAAADMIPDIYYVGVTASGTASATYSVTINTAQ